MISLVHLTTSKTTLMHVAVFYMLSSQTLYTLHFIHLTLYIPCTLYTLHFIYLTFIYLELYSPCNSQNMSELMILKHTHSLHYPGTIKKISFNVHIKGKFTKYFIFINGSPKFRVLVSWNWYWGETNKWSVFPFSA